MIAKHIDRFPLLKLDQVIDRQPSEKYLNRQKKTLPPRQSRLSPVVHFQSRLARTMVQPLQSHTRTQPHHSHRFQPVLAL